MGISATRLTASGAISAVPVRVRGFSVSTAGGGTVELKDGGASGTSKMVLGFQASTVDVYVPIPGEGIICATDAYGTLTTIADVTAFYEELP